MLKQWKSLSDLEKIEALHHAIARIRAEIAEIGVDAREAKSIAKAMGEAMVVLEKRL